MLIYKAFNKKAAKMIFCAWSHNTILVTSKTKRTR